MRARASPLALDLLDRMLRFAPHRRITVAEALAHPYLSEYHAGAGAFEPTAAASFKFDFETDNVLPTDNETIPKKILQRLMLAEARDFGNWQFGGTAAAGAAAGGAKKKKAAGGKAGAGAAPSKKATKGAAQHQAGAAKGRAHKQGSKRGSGGAEDDASSSLDGSRSDTVTPSELSKVRATSTRASTPPVTEVTL